MEHGWKNRATGATAMNADSSRLVKKSLLPQKLCKILTKKYHFEAFFVRAEFLLREQSSEV